MSLLGLPEDELTSIGRRKCGSSSSGEEVRTRTCHSRYMSSKVIRSMTVFYNSTSEKHKPSMKPSMKIEVNLKESKVVSGSSDTRNDECDFAFMAEGSVNIVTKCT